jgi:hypothetical protein
MKSCALWALAAIAAHAQTATVKVEIAPGSIINSFDPDSALGSSIDVLSRSGIDKVYTPHIVQEALSAGWGPITYRNNSELRMAAWHWTENGTWSDGQHKSGYFTGSSELKDPLHYILSYALPHRGFSASDDRPLDSPSHSHWKSHPYLTSKFTGESDALHPQWVVMDLRAEKPVNAVQIGWVDPYAKVYRVDYWAGRDPLSHAPEGVWKTPPGGTIGDGHGSTVTLKLAPEPVAARYLRIWMTESSNTCDLHGSGDIRNCAGYAIQSFQAGTINAGGGFAVVSGQPVYTTSSIDPWHAQTDVNATGSGQHSGFDVFFTSGLTNNLPAMVPVTMLYGTPDDSAAQIAYLEKRGYPIGWIEMGEEPDGKHMLPEDYAALYLQWAAAIHRVDAALKLGGPVFEGINEDIQVWPDSQGRTSWMGRFLAYLRTHQRMSDLAFVSLEHYPFEPCGITWKSLYREPPMMKHILEALRHAGVPPEVPIMVTESHISWRLTGPMSTIFAALWLADNVGSFFEGGGAAFFHSPIQPQPVQDSCLGPATWSNFVADDDYNITGYTSPYWAARLINLEWVAHRSGVHRMYPSSVGIEDVTSYAVHRPDGSWSLMLVNRNETEPHSLHVVFQDAAGSHSFTGPVTMTSFGSEQYVWQSKGPKSYADPDGPPAARIVEGGPGTVFTLPKASLTVLRGRIEGGER